VTGSTSARAPGPHPTSTPAAAPGPRRAKARRVPPSAEAGDASDFGARPARCSARALILPARRRERSGIRARPSPSDGMLHHDSQSKRPTSQAHDGTRAVATSRPAGRGIPPAPASGSAAWRSRPPGRGVPPSAAARHAPLAGSGGPSRSGVAMRPARDRLGAERRPRGSTGPERRAPPVPEPPRGAEAGPTRAVPLRPGQRDGARRRCDRAVKPAGRSAVGASSPSSARRRPRSRYRPAPRSGSSRSRCVARRTLG